jgi:hypothetical protein
MGRCKKVVILVPKWWLVISRLIPLPENSLIYV